MSPKIKFRNTEEDSPITNLCLRKKSPGKLFGAETYF